MSLYECFLLTPPESSEKKRISREIDKMLKEQEKIDGKTVKLLLLGCGESGKSTFIKQMRIIHSKGFNDEERFTFIRVIHQNIASSVQALVNAMESLEIEYSNSENEKNSEIVKTLEVSKMDRIHPDLFIIFKEIWNDEGVKICYQRRNEFQLIDSCKYYFDAIERIQDSDFVPNDQDILRSRVETTRIMEYEFGLKNLFIKIIDVGGQRSERRKWLHCFDNVMTVIFLVAISEYDQNLQENHEVNRLQESLGLFENLLKSEWFVHSSFVLFLNKIDVFEEKIMNSYLGDFIPEYTGPKNDPYDARNFIRTMFSRLMQGKVLFSHFTCATDTENIKVVFTAVENTIRSRLLDGFSLE